ncbi:hypothetical protein QBC34DRAFT_444370 [Podospora aff. communis PSN243]|uniref:Uncharacterized protein n=1 Tax=Podospora aff. communis PSN243 TaxID=3040156 RepID=A0AAV9FY66_9PEZI|nr:hypothetical protein QBC34DRAFT_444370 [Podospora aff. communis PSN243]
MAATTTAAGGAQQKRLIFGIDFGTTYSGVSYAWSVAPSAILTVQKWPEIDPNYPGNEEVKTPTVIKYSASEAAAWGYSVSLGEEGIRWVKLLLLDDADLEKYLTAAALSHLTNMRDMIRESGKEVVDVVADYLRLLWGHVLEEVGGANTRDTAPFTVVVTVPAIWKGYARSRMHLAVKKAGILDERPAGRTMFHFTTEPEAAALARLTDFARLDCIQTGDCVTVADFGGGTVDIISYQVTQTKPLRIKEVVEGEGRLSGAVFLDQAFRKYIIGKFGQENWDRVDKDDRESFLQEKWEVNLKRKYTKKTKRWTFQMKNSFRDVRREPLELTAEELLQFFTTNDAIKESLELVKSQLAAVKAEMGTPAKYVIMAGGFGGSRFLKEAIDDIVEGETEVLQGSDTSNIWSAISRGAVMSVHEGLLDGEFAKVESRIARACYGLSYSETWVEGRHDPRDKYWCTVEACYRAKDQMQWFLKKGDRSSRPEAFEQKLRHTYKPDSPGNYPHLESGVWTYDDHNPPSRRETGVSRLRGIRHTALVPFGDLPVKPNHAGEPMRVFDFQYAAMCFGNSVDISIIGPDGSITRENVEIVSDTARPSTPPRSTPAPLPLPEPEPIPPVPPVPLVPPVPAELSSNEANSEPTHRPMPHPLLPPPPRYTPRELPNPQIPRPQEWNRPGAGTPPLSPPPQRISHYSTTRASSIEGYPWNKLPNRYSATTLPSPPLSPTSTTTSTTPVAGIDARVKPAVKNPFEHPDDADVESLPTAHTGSAAASTVAGSPSRSWALLPARETVLSVETERMARASVVGELPATRAPASGAQERPGESTAGAAAAGEQREGGKLAKWRRISSLLHGPGRRGGKK